MVRVGEHELICDFAETYHVFNYRELPMMTAAVLASGLGPESRIMMKLAGVKVPPTVALQAIIADRLGIIMWQNSGSKRNKAPKSILDLLTGKEESEAVMSFSSGEDFEAYRQKLLAGG